MSMFTRQHYSVIAAVMRRDKPRAVVQGGYPDHLGAVSEGKLSQWRSLRERFCDAFLADNPKFDADRFRMECS